MSRISGIEGLRMFRFLPESRSKTGIDFSVSLFGYRPEAEILQGRKTAIA
jgi:hypothetical protein